MSFLGSPLLNTSGTIPNGLLPAGTPNLVLPSRYISWSSTTLANGTTIQGGILVPDAVPEERHEDESVITENPVETGSVTNDHAYDLPQDLSLTYLWAPGASAGRSTTFLIDTYTQCLTLKQAKVLLSVSTGKRQYQNMLIKGLSVTTDRDNENLLAIRFNLRQLLLTTTQAVSTSSVAPAAQQATPAATMPTTNSGTQSLSPASNFNFGNPNSDGEGGTSIIYTGTTGAPAAPAGN